MSRALPVARPVLALLAALSAVGCASPTPTEPSRLSDGDSAESTPDRATKDEESAAARQRSVAAAHRKVEEAEQAVSLVQLEGPNKVASAEEEVRAAEFELQKAEAALSAHKGDIKLRARRAEHQIAEAESRLLAARADLAGLERIYAEEPEVLVKEEILRRKRADVGFAEQRVELARLESERVLQVDLVAELRELEEQTRAARAEIEAKRRALQATELGAKKSAQHAMNELLDARDKLREAKEALAKGDS